MWSGWRLTKNSNNYSTRSCLARSVVQCWESRSKERKNKNGQSRNRNSKMPGICEEFMISIRMTKNTKTSLKTREKLETSMADAMPCKRSMSSRVTAAVNLQRAKHLRRFKRRNSMVLWKRMNPKDQEWNLSRRKIMKTTSQAKDKIQYLITTWCTNLFLCHMS